MNAITINPELYVSITDYAAKHKTSMTALVEQYLQRLLRVEYNSSFQLKEIQELSPVIQQLVGVIPVSNQEQEDLNGDHARMEYLQEKQR